MSALHERELLGLLARVRQRDHAMLPVVVSGQLADCPPEGRLLDLQGQHWTALQVRGELGLRRALLQAEHDTALVLLIDEDLQLPLDLAPRVAQRRVHFVDQLSRLLDLFGVRDVEPGLVGAPLARALLSDPPEGLRPSGAARLTVDDAWAAAAQGWLRLRPAGPTGGGPAGLCLAGLGAPERGPAFVARHPELREGLLAHWARTRGGAVARLLGEAWLNGDIVPLMGLIIVWDGARRAAGLTESQVAAVRAVAAYVLRGDEGKPQASRVHWALRDEQLVSRLIGVLDDLFAPSAPELPPEIERSLVRAAEGLNDLAAAQQASPYLPAAFTHQLSRLGDALERMASGEEARAGSHDAALQAIEALKAAEAHRAAGQRDEARATLAVARAATRLGLWLSSPRGQVHDKSAEALASAYLDEGAWVDRCRATVQARLADSGPLSVGARVVLRAADAERRRLDQRFADQLIEGTRLDSPGEGVLALCQVLPKLVPPLLADPKRRLLVLLMDGMSVPVALSLIEGLPEHRLAAWRPRGEPAAAARGLRPALAALPTLTATSRASFFASKLVASHGDEPERNDVRRFAENPHLQGFTARGPQLFLGQMVGAGGALSPALSAALADPKERVIGAVINVVDDQLDGAEQLSLDWSQTQQIPLLTAVLERCDAYGLAVLMVSDHGHVMATERLSAAQAGAPGEGMGGKRWRAVDAATVAAARAGAPGALRPEERLLPEGSWRPAGSAGVVALWPEAVGYNGVGGTHGGLSLAEVVTPVALLVSARQQAEADWAPSAVEPPAWWALKRPRKMVSPAASPSASSSSNLLFQAPVAPRMKVVPVDRGEHPLAQALRVSERFQAEAKNKDQTEEQVALTLRIVDRLAREPNGQEPYGAALEALGLAVAGRRAESQVRAAANLLNAGGPPLLELDRQANRLRLDRRSLIAEYGLPQDLLHDLP
ncbi:MAG: BREX-2 system phosphatase PglZ [Deltaproteobacteria bacterium]|nr:BREX-2 system phosphatase PglZ [Deltaproteobacteria bacterium]